MSSSSLTLYLRLVIFPQADLATTASAPPAVAGDGDPPANQLCATHAVQGKNTHRTQRFESVAGFDEIQTLRNHTLAGSHVSAFPLSVG
jgi:hypothetical protein